MYDSWRERFYPRGLAKARWLSYFAQRFDTVEVNNSFYRLPSEEAFARWRDQTPDGFVMAVKASRYITHFKRLRDCEDAIALFWSRARVLGPRLGPVLFQLPPRSGGVDLEKLETFLALLPRPMRAAFELRDPAWHRGDVYRALDRAGAALVLADAPGARIDPVVTGGWSYVRFHAGARTGPFYARSKLARWADRIAGLPARAVYAYFNNDPQGAAVHDALVLESLLARRRLFTSGHARPPAATT